MEEVGLQVTIERLGGVYTDPSNHNAQLIVYLAESHGARQQHPAEASEVRYFAPEEIPWQEIAFKSTFEALHDWVESLVSIA